VSNHIEVVKVLNYPLRNCHYLHQLSLIQVYFLPKLE